jgi:hypothetical protein
VRRKWKEKRSGAKRWKKERGGWWFGGRYWEEFVPKNGAKGRWVQRRKA